MNLKVLATLGPSSANEEVVKALTKEDVYLFRINLSHTPLNEVEGFIKKVRSWTDVPISLDTEGAQIRNQNMENGSVFYTTGDSVKIHHEEIVGDSNNISFTPPHVSMQLKRNDKIHLDFDSAVFKVVENTKEYCHSIVEHGGYVGSNRATNVDRSIHLDVITPKDKAAIKIGLDMRVRQFSLSFTNSSADVDAMRELIGKESNLICKIESVRGISNLDSILSRANQILIDRGDLSREVPIEKIPYIQRRIISHAKSKGTPVFVATNLLESMTKTKNPTRAEVNDVASTLLMGADGLVLAAETAIGKYPLGAVKMINSLIRQHNRWTPNSSFEDILFDQ
jgi:pyruvate kinase